jgi:precorrin-3B methylase
MRLSKSSARLALLIITGLLATAFGASGDSAWTDRHGRLRLTLPTGWTVFNEIDQLADFKGPADAGLVIFMNPQTGTPAQEIEAKRESLQRSTDYTYTFGLVKDARVGSETGKSLDISSVEKNNPRAAPDTFTSIIVNHKNTQYEFILSRIGSQRPAFDALLASVVFLQ